MCSRNVSPYFAFINRVKWIANCKRFLIPLCGKFASNNVSYERMRPCVRRNDNFKQTTNPMKLTYNPIFDHVVFSQFQLSDKPPGNKNPINSVFFRRVDGEMFLTYEKRWICILTNEVCYATNKVAFEGPRLEFESRHHCCDFHWMRIEYCQLSSSWLFQIFPRWVQFTSSKGTVSFIFVGGFSTWAQWIIRYFGR